MEQSVKGLPTKSWYWRSALETLCHRFFSWLLVQLSLQWLKFPLQNSCIDVPFTINWTSKVWLLLVHLLSRRPWETPWCWNKLRLSTTQTDVVALSPLSVTLVHMSASESLGSQRKVTSSSLSPSKWLLRKDLQASNCLMVKYGMPFIFRQHLPLPLTCTHVQATCARPGDVYMSPQTAQPARAPQTGSTACLAVIPCHLNSNFQRSEKYMVNGLFYIFKFC